MLLTIALRKQIIRNLQALSVEKALPPRNREASLSTQGVYQIGDVYARSCSTLVTSGSI